MAEQKDWAFPAEMRPRPEDWRFDLDRALDAMVLLRAEVPEDAFTASILGTERAGNGVVIENGLVLTIGYLITEASVIWLTTTKGTVVGGTVLAYDQATGFGLVQALGKLGVKPIERGSAASIRVGENVVVAGHGGRAHALKATVFAKREFAGYWEYVLDEALFTAPAHPQWGGAALIGADGKLAAIGSLLVQEKIDAGTIQGNMLVPIDLLGPILDDMVKTGRVQRRRDRGSACTPPKRASGWSSPASRPAARPSAPAHAWATRCSKWPAPSPRPLPTSGGKSGTSAPPAPSCRSSSRATARSTKFASCPPIAPTSSRNRTSTNTAP